MVEVTGWPFHNPSSTEPHILPAQVTVTRTTIGLGLTVVQLFPVKWPLGSGLGDPAMGLFLPSPYTVGLPWGAALDARGKNG